MGKDENKTAWESVNLGFICVELRELKMAVIQLVEAVEAMSEGVKKYETKTTI